MFTSVLAGAQKLSLDGFVYDSSTGEKLIHANIYLKGSITGTQTNEYGYYQLYVPANDSLIIVAAYTGYAPKEKKILLQANAHLDFYLEPDTTLDAVTLEVKKKNITGKSISSIQIPVSQIKQMPVVGSEPDLMKAFQLLPGVSSGKEGSSNLYVRGGSPDQNLILLDDVPLYYVNHLGGFASVFNIDAIKSVKLIKGGFPARYGNRLSSVVDVRMKEGNRHKTKRSFSVGLLNVKFLQEAPLNDKMSYMISVRRMLYDLIIAPIFYFGTDKSFTTGYYFYDINAKINYEANQKNHFYFSLYGGDDNFYVKTFPHENDPYSERGNRKSKYSKIWGNKLAAFRWHHVLSSQTDIISVLSYSKYRMHVGKKIVSTDNNLDYRNYLTSSIQDWSLKTDVNFNISNAYKILTGGGLSYHIFDPATQIYKYYNANISDIDKVKKSYKENAWTYYLYMENHLDFNKKLFLNIGLRHNHLILPEKTFPSFEPRFSFRYKINSVLEFKGGYSQMQQDLHLLSTTGIGMPVDIWLPATKLAPPENSVQYVLGFSMDLFDKKFLLSVEGYHKSIDHLIAYKSGKNFSQFNERWEDIIISGGTGTSYGLEFLLQKKWGKHTGWLSYSWSKTTRRFDELNEGHAFPFSYDRPHDISIVYNYKIKKNIEFSAVWQYGTGYPFTMPVSKYYAIANATPYYHSQPEQYYSFQYDVAYKYSSINGLRMKDFHRLDVGFNFIKQKKRGRRIWNISIINVYNRQNPYFYYLGREEVSPEKYKIVVKQLTLFPFFPSFSYSRNF